MLGAAVVLLIGVVGYLIGVVQVGNPDEEPGGTTSEETTRSTEGAGTSEGTVDPVDEDERDFVDTYRNVAAGVVRVEMTRCTGGATGSGALVEPDLVLTAAHVVDGHASVQLLLSGQSAQGEVVGMSLEDDLALVRASRDLSGHVFSFVEEQPPEGTQVYAAGYALGDDVGPVGPGVISAYGDDIWLEDHRGEPVEISDVMRTTLHTNTGNSGGPVMDVDGFLVGIVSSSARSDGTMNEDGTVDIDVVAGVKYAIPADRAQDLVTQWQTSPELVEPESCEEPPVADVIPLVTALEDSADADVVAGVLFDFFDGINSADYERAFQQYSAEVQDDWSLDEFAESQSTSVIRNVVVLGTRRDGDDLRAVVTFTSYQAPEFGPEGHDCAFWTRDYQLVPAGDHGWSIQGNSDVEGQPAWEACTAMDSSG